ncbi:MAG: glucosaminidase domain-containing protein [Prevotellaceae bacterium]|jgi:LysM repeat protein|nr:glucosaminidase domain-containing protein [Prevotellaceae bacterium]
MGRIGSVWVSFAVMFGVHPGVSAQISNVRQSYILLYKDIAIKNMQEYAIPASITLAQACIESGNGTSRLAREANNHFGIKCHTGWKGKTITQTDDKKDECFRKYNRPEESFKDHADFLRYYNRYAFLFDLSPYDYKGWAQGLKRAGYATNPQYAEMLIKVIEDYRLYEYDRPVKNMPPSPKVLEIPTIVQPDIKSPLYTASLYRTIYQRNCVSFIYAQPGDTYASLAREFRLFKREIMRFNDINKNGPIEVGTMVYVAQKKKQSAREFPKHITEEGESLRSIAQRYGVRLSYICSYNKINKNTHLAEGQTLLLRKP